MSNTVIRAPRYIVAGDNGGSGPAIVIAFFHNSEWTGKAVNWPQNANLTFDEDSTWTITGDCGMGELELASFDQLSSETPVTRTVYYSLTVGGQAVTEAAAIGNVTIVFAGPLEATPSSNSASGGMTSGEAS